MIDIKKKEDCVGCNACQQRCPINCISMNIDEQGFMYPLVDKQKCIGCNLCEKVCPVINQFSESKPISVFAARIEDYKNLLNSSSGGVFYALSKIILESDGVVFGARFDEDWNVFHDYTTSLDQIKLFQGSKYVKSEIGITYQQVEKFLNTGKKVLFTGTGCQIAGLKRFLRKNYTENLVTVEIICHGVPSPMIWQRYLNDILKHSLYKISGSGVKQIKQISFRDKQLGWKKYGFSVEFKRENSTYRNNLLSSDSAECRMKFFEPTIDNIYMMGFLRNLYLRPSCYECPAKCGKSHSDILLGDYWGIEEEHPEYYSRDGVSLVMVNTQTGKMLFESAIADYITSSYDQALKHNKSIEVSSPKPQKGYDLFWKKYPQYGIFAINMAFKVMEPSILSRLKSYIYRKICK